MKTSPFRYTTFQCDFMFTVFFSRSLCFWSNKIRKFEKKTNTHEYNGGKLMSSCNLIIHPKADAFKLDLNEWLQALTSTFSVVSSLSLSLCACVCYVCRFFPHYFRSLDVSSSLLFFSLRILSSANFIRTSRNQKQCEETITKWIAHKNAQQYNSNENIDKDTLKST